MSNDEVTALYFEDLYDFSNEDDVKRLQEKNQNLVVETHPMFSFMMCVYNDMSLFNSAVNSLIKQSYTNWELVILDNSDKNPLSWDMIQNAVKADPRVTAYKSEQNVGWPKGSSILLQYVRGKYTTFLAADDCINADALEWLNAIALAEDPDVIWVGNMYIKQISDDEMSYVAENIPPYRIYQKDNRSETIYQIMSSVYYNSFFHYMKVDFLRKNGIDFFEPYYADGAGMTKAMVEADKMVSLDKPIYFLTLNTSQTVGRYTWGSYDSIFCNQWRCLREIFKRDQYIDMEHLYYVAGRILKNLFGNIAALCTGHCRNKYMTPIEKDTPEIIQELEDCLASDEVAEMLQITGTEYFVELLDAIAYLPSADISIYEDSWIYSCIMLSFYREQLSLEELIKVLLLWLLQEKNIRSMGFDYCVDLIDTMEDSALIPFYGSIQKIMDKYDTGLAILC